MCLALPPLAVPSPARADNKFSSFVRQLNFYGFRKVKSNITVEGHDTKWWEFKVRFRSHACSAGRVCRQPCACVQDRACVTFCVFVDGIQFVSPQDTAPAWLSRKEEIVLSGRHQDKHLTFCCHWLTP